MSENQPNNPLHGVKLQDMLELLIKEYSWEQLSTFVDV
ncbi:MAG: VF530 family DNA-binding protein, partial [Flavobacteriales bacterium]|nr:VF530 family DNA-binding protein [Flavobacteriales bacterium]